MIEKVILRNEDGVIAGKPKIDLHLEEGHDYLPNGYSSVYELALVIAHRTGEGCGDRLMREFLEHPNVRSADLVFCDPTPNLGPVDRSNIDDRTQIDRLKKFYRRHGFECAVQTDGRWKSDRMWRVQRGRIPAERLPA